MDEQLYQQPLSPVMPTVQKPFQLNILIFAIIFLLLSSASFFAFQYIQLKKQITTVAPTPIPSPTSTPDETTSWETINMKGCSTRHTDFQYSIKTPDGWTISKNQDNQYRTVYKLTGETNKSIEINCDTAGVGDVICIDSGEQFQYGCFWTSDPNTKGFGAKYNKNNLFGTFVVTTYGVEKSLLTQILSTFKFKEEPSKCVPVTDPCNPLGCDYDQSKCKTSSYICPANGWINCMPMLSEEAKQGCTSEAIAWYKKNCPNFQGVAQ